MTGSMLRPIGWITCLVLAACASPPPPPALAPAVAPEPALPAEQQIAVCVVTAQGAIQNVPATFRPHVGDTVVDGRRFGEVHSTAQPQYAAGQTWFIQNERMMTMGRTYVQFGVQRVPDTRILNRVGSYEGVPLFAEFGASHPPSVLYLPIRPGCEMQPYQVYHFMPARPQPTSVEPLRIPTGALRLITISAGGRHTCGLTSDGSAYCWVEQEPEEPEDDTIPDRRGPEAVAAGLRMAAIATGSSHTCGLAVDGQAFCWGENDAGQLGDGTRTWSPGATAVAGELRFAGISAGMSHSCGLTTDGEAYCWGWNERGQLGDGTSHEYDHEAAEGAAVVAAPTPVAGGLRFIELSGGRSHTCGITTAGRVYCWGEFLNDETDKGAGARHVPTAVAIGPAIAEISSGTDHICALTADGDAYCWGGNQRGQLGDGTNTDRVTPVAVSGELNFAAISSGGVHTCGLRRTAEAYCWGANRSGQLGDGTTDDQEIPTPVGGGLRFAVISAGDSHTCGLTLDGEVFCWGWHGFADAYQATEFDSHRSRWSRLPLR
jgi:alpha-tubulin suppressor-like RCC1 family protein